VKFTIHTNESKNAAGGGEKAFHDVGNAYRRLRAELKRQEARKERRNFKLEPSGRVGTDSNEYRSEKQNPTSLQRGEEQADTFKRPMRSTIV
jgi:hypothetical protein